MYENIRLRRTKQEGYPAQIVMKNYHLQDSFSFTETMTVTHLPSRLNILRWNFMAEVGNSKDIKGVNELIYPQNRQMLEDLNRILDI